MQDRARTAAGKAAQLEAGQVSSHLPPPARAVAVPAAPPGLVSGTPRPAATVDTVRLRAHESAAALGYNQLPGSNHSSTHN